MLVYQAYRYELDPNNRQRTHMAKHAGCARFAYNWGLVERIRRYETKKGKERFTNSIEQHKELNQLKLSKFPWMYEVSKCAPQAALQDLEKAFHNFRRGLKNRTRIGFPKFKKKGVNDSFRLEGTIKVIGKVIQLPRLGKIRLKEIPAISGRILNATVSRKADRWFVSICVKQERVNPSPVLGPKIGVDLGIHSLATLSNGIAYENPRALASKLRKLKKLSRQVSRKSRGSRNRRKAVIRLAKLHWRISNIRKDVLHKITSYLAKNHNQIMIEDLCVKGLIKNRSLSRAITDVGFFEFRRQLEYKTKWYGSELIVAPRFFPSSKRCSSCGFTKKELSLYTRYFRCEVCGLELNRDLNAAINLVAAGWAETENACLEVGGCRPLRGQCPSMKQEPNTKGSLESAG
ncbi:MAG: RNA-guided endonuclease InsQ/TnpB family protein [Promethearchaeota archaeon]